MVLRSQSQYVPGFHWHFISWFVSCLWTSLLLCVVSPAWAYLPATPVNGTVVLPDVTGTSGSATNASILYLQWLGGGLEGRILYGLVGANSNGPVNKGAFVHFSENDLTNDTTTTPWVALISCDANATDASQTIDTFSLARDRGAVAAYLYSLYSDRCQINPVYADPTNFDSVMNIFTSPSLTFSKLVEAQFNANNITQGGQYNAQFLNTYAAQVNATVTSDVVTSPGYLFAILVASNASGSSGLQFGNSSVPTTNGSSTGNANGNSSGSERTTMGLSMTALYTIIACTSGLQLADVLTFGW